MQCSYDFDSQSIYCIAVTTRNHKHVSITTSCDYRKRNFLRMHFELNSAGVQKLGPILNMISIRLQVVLYNNMQGNKATCGSRTVPERRTYNCSTAHTARASSFYGCSSSAARDSCERQSESSAIRFWPEQN